MNEEKICKYCKSKIYGNTTVCPYCHKKQDSNTMMMITITIIAVFLIGIATVTTIIITTSPKKSKHVNSDGKYIQTTKQFKKNSKENTTADTKDSNLYESKSEIKSETQTETQKETQQETTAELKDFYTVGEVASTGGIDTTLVKIDEYADDGNTTPKPGEGNVFIVCEFKITNHTKNQTLINSQHCFETTCDGNPATSSMNGLLASKSAKPLDTILRSGDTLDGFIAYEVPSNYKDLEISFKPVSAGKQVKFKYTKE